MGRMRGWWLQGQGGGGGGSQGTRVDPQPCPALCLFGKGQVKEGEGLTRPSPPHSTPSSPYFLGSRMDLNGGLSGKHENKESNTGSVLKVGGQTSEHGSS